MLILGGTTGRSTCHFHESIVLHSCSVLSSKDGVVFLLSVELDGRMLILGGPTGERRVTFMSYSVGMQLCFLL